MSRANHPIFLIVWLIISTNNFDVKGKLVPLNYENLPSYIIHNAVSYIVRQVVKPNETMVLINIGNRHETRETKIHPKYTIFNIRTNKNMMTFKVRDRSLITLSLYYISSPELLENILKMMNYFPINNPSRNILLVDKSDDAENITIPQYFKVLWRYGFLRPIIIKLRANDTEPLVDIYHWPALEPSAKCGTNISTYKKLGFYTPKNNSITLFLLNESLFHMQPPKHVSYCQLKVSVVVYPPFIFPAEKKPLNATRYIFKRGFEIKLIKAVAKSFGFNITFQKSRHRLDWGSLESNGSATGIYKRLMDADTDIGISSFTYIPRNEFIDFGPTYAFEDLIWCIPKQAESQLWTNLFYPYGCSVFILYKFTYILTSIMICLLSKFRNSEPPHNRKLENCLVKCAADIYGNTYNVHTPKTHVVRILYILWLLVTVHMSVLYSGRLFSRLTLQVEDYKYLTFQDILDSDFRLQLFSYTKRFITNDDPSTKKLNLRKFQDCACLIDCLESVAVSKDSAICLTLSMALFVENRHWAIVCQKRAKLVSLPVTMLFRKHHYLYQEISKKVLFLFETGLIDYWKKQAIKSYNNYSKPLPFDFKKLDDTAVSYPSRHAFTFKKLLPAFEILMYGHFLATVVFLIELGLYYKQMYFKYKHEAEATYIEFNN